MGILLFVSEERMTDNGDGDGDGKEGRRWERRGSGGLPGTIWDFLERSLATDMLMGGLLVRC